MAEAKTKPTEQSVAGFIDKIPEEQVRDDCKALVKMMKKITGLSPKMWGPSIVGFGKYHYKYDSGHEGDSCLAAFSPRKQNLTVYLMAGFAENQDLLKKLGKHKTSKCCLYIKKLDDIDSAILEKLIKESFDYVTSKYPSS